MTARQPDRARFESKGQKAKRWHRLLVVCAVTLIVVSLPLSAPSSTGRRSSVAVVSPEHPQDKGFSAPRPGSGVSWAPEAGIGLPFSPTAGPLCLSGGRASCFAHTRDGAAIAAVQLLVRTFPAAGPETFEPTIAAQVVGSGRSSLARRTRRTYDRAIESGPDALSDGGRGWAAGYRLDARGQSPSTAVVEVLLNQSDGLTQYAVDLVWVRGDWKLRVPGAGSWAARAASTRRAADYRSYDRLGIGQGGAI